MIGKSMITFIIATCVASAAFCREPGGWLNDITLEVVTPHLEWTGKLEGGPLRALFITCPGAAMHFQKPSIGARMVVEWAQRMDADFEAVVGQGVADKENPRLIFDMYHPVGFEGTRADEKEAELTAKLSKPYELYVLNHVSFDALMPEHKKVILDRVVGGAGLIMIGGNRYGTELTKMFKRPDPLLVKDVMRLDRCPYIDGCLKRMSDGTPELWKKESLPLRSYSLGKGRIVQVTRAYEPANSVVFFMPEWLQAFQKKDEAEKRRLRHCDEAPIPLWWGEFESLNAGFLRLFFYAAGRKPLCAVSCPELAAARELEPGTRTLTLALDNQTRRRGEIAYRVRSDENKVIRSGKVAFDSEKVALELPALPGGEYYLDITSAINGKTDDFGCLPFVVKFDVTASIEMADDRVYDGKAIDLTLVLSKPVVDGRVKVSLADSPYDRVWWQGEFTAAGALKVPLRLDGWYLPNRAGTLRVEVESGGRSVAYARKTLFRPEGNRPPPWIDMVWGESLTPLHALANQASQGWWGMTKAVSGSWGTSIQNHMVSGEVCMPWAPLPNWQVWNNQHKRSVGYMLDPKTKETRPEWCANEGGALTYGATKEEVERLEKMPVGMERRADAVMEVMRIWNNSVRPFDYGVELFNLGDETGPGYDTFSGKFAEDEFRKFLRSGFGGIDKLNQAWKRSYKSFEEVPLLTTDDAIKKKLPPEGAAQRLFAEANYYDVYRALGSAIRKRSPLAFYGPTSSALAEDLVHPELNASFSHPETGMIELRRTMAPDSLYLPLFGYEIPQGSHSNKRLWESAISGVGRGNTYFAGNIYAEGGTLAVDFRDKMPKLTAARLMLQGGVGPLLRGASLGHGSIAVLASLPSSKARLLDPSQASQSALTSDPLFAFCKERGVTVDHFTTEALKKFLPNCEALVLPGVSAISKDDAELIVEFAKKGGTVVADLNPGIFNEHLAPHDANPLSELFGDLKPVAINGRNTYQGAEIAGVAGIAPMSWRQAGKGRALLMNFTLSELRTALGEGKAFDAFMDGLLSELRVKTPFKVAGLPKGSVIRLRHGQGFDLAAFANDSMACAGKGEGQVTVTFPKAGFIYRVGQGFLKEGDTVSVPFDPPFCFLTSFPSKQSAPEIKLSSRTAEPGKALSLDLTGFASGRVLNLQLRGADGKLVRPRSEIHEHELIVVDGKRKSFPVRFAYTDPKGEYRLRLTDVATGLTSDTTVTLK